MKYSILIKPNSCKGPFVEKQDDGSFIVYVNKPATEGKANDALIGLLSKYFKVSKTSVLIANGKKSRYKIVEVG